MEEWSQLQQQIVQLQKENESLTRSVMVLRTELQHARFPKIAKRVKVELSVRWTHDMVDQCVSILVRDGDERGLVLDIPESELCVSVGGKFPALTVKSE